jgi:hypothetical protein
MSTKSLKLSTRENVFQILIVSLFFNVEIILPFQYKPSAFLVCLLTVSP